MNQPKASDFRALASLRGLTNFDPQGLAAMFSAAAGDKGFALAYERNTKALQAGIDDEAAMNWATVVKEMSLKWSTTETLVVPSAEPELQCLWGKRPAARKAVEASKPGKQAKRVHEKLHIYAASAALCIELDALRAEGPQGALKSLTLEFAKASSTGSGAKEYAWEQKIAFQLTRKELPMFVAILMGWSSSWEAKGHGTEHDKSLSVVAQNSGLLFTLRQGQRSVLVPAPGPELYGVTALAMKALLQNDPHLSSQCVLAMCKSGSMFGRRAGT